MEFHHRLAFDFFSTVVVFENHSSSAKLSAPQSAVTSSLKNVFCHNGAPLNKMV